MTAVSLWGWHSLAYFWFGINCNFIILATGQLNGNGFTNHYFKRDKSVYFPNNREILPPATHFCFLSKSFYPLRVPNWKQTRICSNKGFCEMYNSNGEGWGHWGWREKPPKVDRSEALLMAKSVKIPYPLTFVPALSKKVFVSSFTLQSQVRKYEMKQRVEKNSVITNLYFIFRRWLIL